MPSSGNKVVQQLDGNEGDAGTEDCLHEAAREFTVAGQRKSEHRDYAGDNNDGLCQGSGDVILHNIERVVPRQGWLVGSPAWVGVRRVAAKPPMAVRKGRVACDAWFTTASHSGFGWLVLRQSPWLLASLLTTSLCSEESSSLSRARSGRAGKEENSESSL